MTKILIISLFIVNVSNAANTDIGKIAIFAEENHQIIEQLAPVSDDFKLDSENTERLQAYAHYQDEIRQLSDNNQTDLENIDCNEHTLNQLEEDKVELSKTIDKRRWVVGAYARYVKGSQDFKEYYGLSNNSYTEYMNKNQLAWMSDYKGLTEYYLSYRPEIEAEWDTYSDEKKIDKIKKYIKAKANIDVPNGLLLKEQIISNATENPESWRQSFTKYKDVLTKDEKLELISQLGGLFLEQYNTEKANRETGKPTSIENMFTSIKDNTPGGICTDVVAAQSKIAQELGIDPENIYRVSYMSSVGSHQTLAIIDPDNPNKMYKVNYDELKADEVNKGLAQLSPGGDMPNIGTTYRVSDANGKPVLQMPTELGKMLREASGFDTQNDISRNYNINKVSASTDFGEAAVVSGELFDGSKVTAITFNSNYEGIKYGISAYKTDKELETLEVSTNGVVGFVQMNPHYTYKATDNLRVTANTEFLSEIQYVKSDVNYINSNGDRASTSNSNIDSATSLTPGVEVSYTSSSLDAYAKVEAETFVWVKDAHDQSSKKLHLNGINYKTGLSVGITEDMKASLDAAVYTRNLGDYYIVSAALEDKKRNYVLETKYQAPIDKNMPSFAPGAQSVTQVTGSKSWLKKDNTGPTLTFAYTKDEFSGSSFHLGGEWAFY